mmetsp:Transcript_15818/g.19901  ORF Transcript_15818/g.19901 Transcript_15818/m.19901 type:complete len:83 (-) Transcript_15818:2603-2851(-)
MLRLPLERLGAKGLRFMAALRRALVSSRRLARGSEPDRDMLRDSSRERECDYDRDVMETSKESPVRYVSLDCGTVISCVSNW